SARKVAPAATAPESRNSRPSRTKTTPVVHSHHRKLIRTLERPHRMGASPAPRGAWFALGFDSGVARATHDGPQRRASRARLRRRAADWRRKKIQLPTAATPIDRASGENRDLAPHWASQETGAT